MITIRHRHRQTARPTHGQLAVAIPNYARLRAVKISEHIRTNAETVQSLSLARSNEKWTVFCKVAHEQLQELPPRSTFIDSTL